MRHTKDQVRAIIRRHYGLSRPVTDAEVLAELLNLQRKANKGNLDDSQAYLAACLHISPVIKREVQS